MQRSAEMAEYRLRATDGAVGTIDDLLFDERHFGLRWIVVDTGTWITGRKVLLPPSALGAPDPAAREYPVDLTRDQIEAAPGLETDEPVSRQLEVDIFRHYAWDPYWYAGDGYVAAGGVMPLDPGVAAPTTGIDERRKRLEGDPCLRSVGEVTGYYVEATDGSIGHVEDFIIDENEWVIRFLMIDTKNWWPGRMVLISPNWPRHIDWNNRKVLVEVTREKVKGAPEFDPSMTIDRDLEKRISSHYGYPSYWTG